MYQRYSSTMGCVSSSRSAGPKPAVPADVHDPRVDILGDLQGKVEQARLVDIYFSDSDLFPQMRVDSYMDYSPLPTGELALQRKSSYLPLRESTLMNLRELSLGSPERLRSALNSS